MQTEIVAPPSAVARAIEILRAGEVVALPTETVYGLAADARNSHAVARIFEAKERPRFDPLIVHLPTRASLASVARVESDLVSVLIQTFWPGPFSIVLPKRQVIPDIVTAGLETVAVRMSAHPIFQQIISAFAGPLAAPSANRFSRISPTTAQHVHDELASRIPLIVDGGATTYGVESTIVRVVSDAIEILRAGPITTEMLAEFGRIRAGAANERIIAPGQLRTHYAPRTKLMVVNKFEDFSGPADMQIGGLSFGAVPSVADCGSSADKPQRPTTFATMRCLSARGDLREAAANLFRALRELDAAKLDLIVAEKVPDEGIGIAINDRLRRAASEC